jgi:type VI secretion system secreted protein VgrG
MSGNLRQSGRIGEFTSPLGQDVLVLTEFSSTEGLSELFEYRIEALSQQESLDFDQALGKGCMVQIATFEGKTRFFHGIMTEAEWVGKRDDLYIYRVVLRPWLWLLGNKADCRIFLDKTVLDIIQEVFTKAGFTDFEFRTTESYNTIEYCVQYRETDLAFVCRLMEHYGIYYFFEPSDGKHTMLMADSRSSLVPVPDLPTVTFNPIAGPGQKLQQTLREWASERRFRTGKVCFNEYDYLQPKKDLRASKEASESYTHSNLEVYDYFYKYTEKDQGEDHARYRLEAEQAIDHRRRGAGDAISLYPGGLVTLDKHPSSQENMTYLVVRTSFHFTEQYYRSSRPVVRTDEGYECSFVFQPANRPFRALPLTPKPRIYGIQTAKVVGKQGEDGEEISTDNLGRVWVKFHWDREPQKTCPIRVAHVWSSAKWGATFIPRIGMEVVVDFLEGDPDRPLVTGCVYNGDNNPPYDLPDNKTMSGWKSNSSKGGNGYNEFVFEDKKGSEKIRMHGEKDHEVVIRNSESRTIGETFSTPQGRPSRNVQLKNGDDNLTIDMGDQIVALPSGNQTTNLSGQCTINAAQQITLIVGGGTSSITMTPDSITLQSPTINIFADENTNINGGAGISLYSDHAVHIHPQQQVMIDTGGDILLAAGGAVSSFALGAVSMTGGLLASVGALGGVSVLSTGVVSLASVSGNLYSWPLPTLNPGPQMASEWWANLDLGPLADAFSGLAVAAG